MLAAPTRDWSVFQQIFADHWEAFQHTHPRYQTPYYDGLVAKMLACGNPEKIGYIAYRCLYCGQGKHLVAMSCKSSLCLRCAKVSVDNWVSQVSKALHAGVIYRHIILTVPAMFMHRLAFLLQVSAQAVLNWIRDFAKGHYEKLEPMGKTMVLERDEMGHYVTKKRQKRWIWKALDRDTGQWLDGECGRRDTATLKKMVERLAQWDVHVYYTDTWGTYATIIPQDKLGQSKATTHDLERRHCRQRHWFGRFKRRSIMVSKSLEMVDLTMALFATF